MWTTLADSSITGTFTAASGVDGQFATGRYLEAMGAVISDPKGSSEPFDPHVTVHTRVNLPFQMG